MSKFDSLLPSKTPNLQNSKAPKVQNVEPPAERKAGRPKAKHSDRANYHQTTIYVRRDVFGQAKAKLLADGGGEMSALIERLLREWLERSASAELGMMLATIRNKVDPTMAYARVGKADKP
jgi:hypothetical protein